MFKQMMPIIVFYLKEYGKISAKRMLKKRQRFSHMSQGSGLGHECKVGL